MIQSPRVSTLFPYTTLFRSLDEVMRQDPHGRVACETLVTTGLAVVAGEITTTAQVNYDERSEEHTSELQSLRHLVCRLLLEKKNTVSEKRTRARDNIMHNAG